MQLKQTLSLFIYFLTLTIPCLSHASYIEYCKGTKTTSTEDAVIQRLVPQFGNAMGCEVGNNCLLKWDVKQNAEKFSIAWKKQCGPIINGIYQLGDNGHGSTFVCEFANKNSICCWPLGYKHVKSFILCSDTIFGKYKNKGKKYALD